MRFDKLIGLFILEDIEDGLGGHTEAQNTIHTFNANVEELGLETTMKIYGVGISGNIQAVILGSITLDKNKEYRVKYNNDLYKINSIRTIKNKTSLLLEVIEND